MERDKEFANNVYLMISGFMDKISSVEDLEEYYLINKKAISTMKEHDINCYDKLIDDFKKRKNEINRK
tara:strand:- start:1514 stop:1717 length:204 start_codon:yes stop_codon:yes gene_type:complete